MSPGDVTSLSATPEPAKPRPAYFPTEAAQTPPVPGHRVVVEEPLHHAPQPLPDFGHRVMPPPQKLRFHSGQFLSKAFHARPTVHPEPSGAPRLPAGVREAQELERLRFAFAPSLPIAGGISTKLQQTRLVGVKFQPELRQSLPPRRQALL